MKNTNKVIFTLIFIGFLTGLLSACQNDLNAFTIDGLEHTQSSTPTIEPTGNPLFEYTKTVTPKPPTRPSTSTPTQSISNFPKTGFIHYYQEALQQIYPLQIDFSGSDIVFRPLTKNASCHIKTLAEKTFTLEFELEFETDGRYITTIKEENNECELIQKQQNPFIVDVTCYGSGSRILSFISTNKTSGKFYEINIPVYSINPPKTQEIPSFIPENLSIEEYLVHTYFVDDVTISFTPDSGTRQEILDKHKTERKKKQVEPMLINILSPEPVSLNLTNGDMISFFVKTEHIPADTEFIEAGWDWLRYGHDIYTLYAEKSDERVFEKELGLYIFAGLPKIWSIGNHWFLEIASTSGYNCGKGDIFKDGQSLAELNGYFQAFGFQFMHGKPFYFYEKNGEIGVNYNGYEIPLGYDSVPHYNCCSGSAYNPQVYENMVAFFPLNGETQYYVEIGVFE